MATQPIILFIVGSLREQSFNKQMAKFAETLFAGKATVDYLDWSEFPLFNQDIEFPTPAVVELARKQVAKSDALWVFTPEYNHGVPGGLKNTIDWLSRPSEDGSTAVIRGKIATFSGVGGSGCVRHSFAAWQSTIDILKLEIPPAGFTGMSFDREMFTSNVLQLDDATRSGLEKQAVELLGKIA